MNAITNEDFRREVEFDVEGEVDKRVNSMQSCELLLPFLGFGTDEKSKFRGLFD